MPKGVFPKEKRRKPIPVGFRFWAFVTPVMSGCWEWTGTKSASGYGSISVNTGTKKKMVRSHRVAWNLIFGDIPNSLHVLHRCDNRACVNPGHLFLGTHSDNMQDMRNKLRGKFIPGHKTAAKLQASDIFFIRSSTETNKSLASKYKVLPDTIQDIRAKRTWKEPEYV